MCLIVTLPKILQMFIICKFPGSRLQNSIFFTDSSCKKIWMNDLPLLWNVLPFRKQLLCSNLTWLIFWYSEVSTDMCNSLSHSTATLKPDQQIIFWLPLWILCSWFGFTPIWQIELQPVFYNHWDAHLLHRTPEPPNRMCLAKLWIIFRALNKIIF